VALFMGAAVAVLGSGAGLFSCPAGSARGRSGRGFVGASERFCGG